MQRDLINFFGTALFNEWDQVMMNHDIKRLKKVVANGIWSFVKDL